MSKRKKYNYELRLRCVEAVLKGKHSILSVSRDNDVTPSSLRKWLAFYEHYGKTGLKRKAGGRYYSEAFKAMVLNVMGKENLSLRKACVRFNIQAGSTITKWRKAYESKGALGLMPQPKGRPKNMSPPIKRKPKNTSKPLTREEELLQENERLRAENELLKKLHALVQADKKQEP